jgi:hypothetical protein
MWRFVFTLRKTLRNGVKKLRVLLRFPVFALGEGVEGKVPTGNWDGGGTMCQGKKVPVNLEKASALVYDILV